jgi:hypothetical protein
MNAPTICSWDVGLKNLSYCILQGTAKYKILDWDNINIVDQGPPTKCSRKTRSTGKQCIRNAKCSATIDGQQHFFCGVHMREHDLLVKASLTEPQFTPVSKDKACKCSFILRKKKTLCGKNAYWQHTEGGQHVCTTHVKQLNKERVQSMKLRKIKKINANKFPIDQLKINLFHMLDQRPQLLQVDEMIIENQPTYKNPRMKSIANALFDYFLMRGVIDRVNTNSTIQKVRFICPSNKLKVESDNTIKVLSKTENGEKYKMTKALAVSYCKQMIADDVEHTAFLMAAKKKDDLSDCYLQGVHYLSKNKPKK